MERWKFTTTTDVENLLEKEDISFPNRMFVDGQRAKNMHKGRFGLLCFSVNRIQTDWEICECDHINGDRTDDRRENVRCLTRKENKANYCKRSRAT
jgi:hypothetical protein